MKILPVCFFTHSDARTSLASLSLSRLRENLSAKGYSPRIVLCHDGSSERHSSALREAAGDWLAGETDSGGRGLGASMNLGIRKALSMSDVFLRTEDDWVLERPLDVGPWVDFMKEDSVGAIRMGMMFREPDELRPYGPEELGLLRMRPRPYRKYNFNNQVALVHEMVHDLVGMYDERLPPQACEGDFATRFNAVTSKCQASPWVCWPKGWATKTYDDPSMAFIHAGKSTLGHRQYTVPERYRKYIG